MATDQFSCLSFPKHLQKKYFLTKHTMFSIEVELIIVQAKHSLLWTK